MFVSLEAPGSLTLCGCRSVLGQDTEHQISPEGYAGSVGVIENVLHIDALFE